MKEVEKRKRKSWRNLQTKKDFLSKLGEHLSIKNQEGWYSITRDEYIQYGGAGLLKRYQFDRYSLLSEIFPEYKWDKNKFIGTLDDRKDAYWIDKKEQRKFMDKLWKILSLNTFEDWYKVTTRQVLNNGGKGLTRYYSGSLSKLLRSVYPEFEWKDEKFHKVPSGYWQQMSNQKKFLDDLAKKLDIKQWSDWYRISNDTIIENGGSGLLSQYGSLRFALMRVYDEHPWDIRLFYSYISKLQQLLHQFVTEIFNNSNDNGGGVGQPKREIYYNFLHENIKLASNKPIETDIYIPELKLAFEYQGGMHYNEIKRYGGNNNNSNSSNDLEKSQSKSLSIKKQTDQLKKKLLQEQNITLIVIPYWWNSQKDSLLSTICEIRPDIKELLQIKELKSKPIPQSPQQFVEETFNNNQL